MKRLVTSCLFLLFIVNPVYSQHSLSDLNVSSCLLMELYTGEIIYSKNIHKKLIPASLVKIMTLVLTFDYLKQANLKMDTYIVVSRKASRIGGRQIYLKEKEKITVEALIKSTAIFSANDAAFALAELVAGSEEAFVEKMNDKARELGLNETTFYNSHGLPIQRTNLKQHVSASDLAKLTKYVFLNHPEIFKYVSIKTDTIRDGAFSLINTDKLLWRRDDVFGLKTGYVRASGFCVVNTAKRDNLTLISIVMGAKTKQARFAISARLLDYGFKKYKFFEKKQLPDAIKLDVSKGESDSVSVVMIGNASALLPKDFMGKPVVKYHLPLSIKAPVDFQQRIGWVTFSLDDEKNVSVPLVAVSSVKEKFSFWEKLKRKYF